MKLVAGAWEFLVLDFDDFLELLMSEPMVEFTVVIVLVFQK